MRFNKPGSQGGGIIIMTIVQDLNFWLVLRGRCKLPVMDRFLTGDKFHPMTYSRPGIADHVTSEVRKSISPTGIIVHRF
jgi:hypothetical protein